ncbi:acetylxylan esterase [Clostridium oryzae]|uniref:Cephalosporin-C deacetylase n=1 Tax=Clostridium oryzae TaxID=1450648 RepID=A0A1V4ITD0_9CLOT|nr:acetylxylan esterase [Clostridium oryzae]OPJ62727.1 cephalosporin-C deacetylase [Clostridium oryzae]
MGYIDDISRDLYTYLPELTKREDFDEFWENTISKAKSIPMNIKKEVYDYPSPYVKAYSITYNGFDETRIHGLYLVPNFLSKKEKYPCLIHYHGFSGNCGKPADFMQWIMMGIAVVSVDCRDQSGQTGNSAEYTNGYTTNLNCKGILNKEEYYYRAVYMDCLKAIDFACEQKEVDQSKIIIEGGSQGGALTMAVCALDSRPYLALADVPSNSNIQKRVEGAFGSFSSVTDYLKHYPDKIEKAFETLSYFDTMNMADKITCKVLASVGLKDNICPGKLYFATYNRIKGEKYIKIYPFNGHEGGGEYHNEIKLKFVGDEVLIKKE